ncbi:MAG: N-acetyl-gamma-glutamyl-phosphate reductase [Actinobacteria bacterium]|nr:N-acetyl-gamma-glutamyl-phosphate reductase [Actinomycetota bacterium]
MKIRAGIIGGSGYTGLELAKILGAHPQAEISFITSRTYEGRNISQVFSSFGLHKNESPAFIAEPSKSDYEDTDILFLCLPPSESIEHMKKIKNQHGLKIIDIGSDFRIKNPDEYRMWYGKEHILPDILQEFTYGLPEVYMELIKNSRLVSNPGCYPTSVLLALAPLLKAGIEFKSINIDSKSGVSGAGRKLDKKYLFGSLDNNFYAYSASGHRHIGEIEQEIKNMSGTDYKICFTPHLLPVTRGIFSSIYCQTDLNKSGGLAGKIDHIFEEFYGDSIFVGYTGPSVPELKDVIGTNNCLIGCIFDERTGVIKVFSVIDNLIKGASGQAVQNMNIMFGINEGEGLPGKGLY